MNSFLSLLDKYKVIWLDSYSVIKNHRGLIPNVQYTIDAIRERGIELRVLTNNAARSPKRQSDRFKQQGLQGIEPEQIVTSGMMAQQFLKNKVRKGKVAYLGTTQAAEYIIEANLEAIPVGSVQSSEISEITAMVFLDDEGYDWNYDINATVNLLRKANIPAVVANSDKIYPVAQNDVSIATGGIAKLVGNILGRKFIRFGKPDTQMFTYAFEDINRTGNFTRRDILMVGDTLHTDILGGNKFGVDTALVMTGNTRATRAEQKIRSSGIIPDYICQSIAE
ncbi:MAG: HAD-IIA family hydrolase [Saprospiraceae bacterium]